MTIQHYHAASGNPPKTDSCWTIFEHPPKPQYWPMEGHPEDFQDRSTKNRRWYSSPPSLEIESGCLKRTWVGHDHKVENWKLTLVGCGSHNVEALAQLVTFVFDKPLSLSSFYSSLTSLAFAVSTASSIQVMVALTAWFVCKTESTDLGNPPSARTGMDNRCIITNRLPARSRWRHRPSDSWEIAIDLGIVSFDLAANLWRNGISKSGCYRLLRNTST